MRRLCRLLFALLLLSLAAGCGEQPVPGIVLPISTVGDTPAYSQVSITANSGTFAIAFTNKASSQQHNLVVVKGNDAVAAAIAEAGAAAGPPDYLPQGRGDIVAATKMLSPGQSETVQLTNLIPGEYTFLCTYPGHYAAGMKGRIVVQ